METLNFSHNWNNKLCGAAFTTIRLHNNSRYVKGCSFEIQLKNKTLGIAELKDKRTVKLEQLNEFVARLDTGYSLPETIGIFRKMYSNIDLSFAHFDLCLFVFKTKKELEHERKREIELQNVRLPYKD